MRKVVSILTTTALFAAIGSTAFAVTPDVYVVNFRNEKSADSQALDNQLYPAISLAGGNIEHVIIDTTTAAKWEKGAYEALDRNIVPLFNKWVGLPGFAVVVDAKSKRVLGCVNSQFQAQEMAAELRRMTSQVTGNAYMSGAQFSNKSTQCPPAFNEPPK